MRTTRKTTRKMMDTNDNLFFSFKLRILISIIALFTINEGKVQVVAKDEAQYKALRHRKLRQYKPCLLLEEDVQLGNHTSEREWVCEMHDEDSQQVEPNAPPGVPIMLKVIGLTEDDIHSNKVVSGITTFMSHSAEISIDCLTIPPDATKVFGRMPSRSTTSSISRISTSHNITNNDDVNNTDNDNQDIDLRRSRNLIDTIDVTKKVLAVRVKARDSAPTASARKISDSIFDENSVNLSTQIDACSYGKMKIVPATGHNKIVNGVIEVQLDIDAGGNTGATLRNAAVTKLSAIVGDIGAQFDHVMFCLPPGTAGNWLAYGYMNHWLTVYNDNWCLYPSAQLHEIGHNLNLNHANEKDKKYHDETGMMGFSYRIEDGPEKCYNNGQSWNLGWYNNRHAVAEPLEKSWKGKIVGIADYGKANANQHTLIVKVPHGSTDYFIGFNRKSGINSGTQEAPDQVTVIEQSGIAPSSLEAKLSEGGTYKISNYLGTSSDVTIEVNEINLTANPPYARVYVYKDNCVPGICNPSCYSDPIHNEIQCCTRNADCISSQECAIGTCSNDNTCVYDTSNCGSSTLRMELMTDNNPEETTWEITDDCNNDKVVMSGGPYSNPVRRHVHELNVNPSKFTVRVYDTKRDGLCCSNGLGSFSATLDNNVIISGGEFKSKKVTGTYGSCDGSSSESVTSGGGVGSDGYTTIFYENFEQGFGHIFMDGGSDATIVVRSKYNGKKSLRLRDDTKTSLAYTKESYDVSGYTKGRIHYYFRARGLQPDKNEGFYFEYSTTNGRSWNIVKSWIVGDDFNASSNGWNEVVEEFDITGVNNMKVRFRCDSHQNNRRIWIDDVTLSAK